MRALLFAVLLSFAADARPVRPVDTFAVQDITEVRISPDGESIVFTLERRDPDSNRTTTRLMRMPAKGGHPIEVTGAPEGARNLRWSPDGKRIAFLAKNAVWIANPFTGGATRICDYDRGNSFLSKAGSSLAWSPDGSRLAFAGTAEPKPPRQDPLVITRLQYKTRTEFSDNRRTHIFIVPAAGGKPRAVTSGNYDEHSIDWGGDEIVFLSNRAADPDARLNYDIYAVNAASGAVRQITRTPGVEMDPVVSPDGRMIAYTATTRAITTIDSVAEDAHVWVTPFAGGAARELNGLLDRRSSSPAWAADGKSIFYAATDHGKTIIFRVPVTGGASEAIVDRQAQAGPFSVSRTGHVATALSTPTAPKEIFCGARRLTSINNVTDWDLVTPENIRFRSFDGDEIEGWLYEPRRKPGKLPMILSIHGGPHGMYGYGFTANFQVYASRGYATLILNPRGSSGYGQKFSDGCVNNWGGGDYKDLMAGVDYVLRTHPEIDANRLGVMGGSYGGFMTNWVITQTQRFKAAVASASLSNLVSFYATSLYQDLVHAEFNGFPWDGENFALLWKWSPLRGVKNVVTPALFLHGEQDNDVHITQAEEMYTALRRRGVEAMLVRYPREGHGFREPKHQLDSATRALDWMDRFLRAEARLTEPRP